jgi:DNA-binding transcriptional regulator YdaS (Cro superfamily)
VEELGYRRVMARVAVLQGGVEQLAARLGVPSSLVTRWVDGLAPIPDDELLRCVDLLL